MAKNGKTRRNITEVLQPFPGIRIRKRRNGNGNSFSWRVEVGAKVTGTAREIRQFPTEEEAKSYASGKHQQRENHGLRSFALSDADRSDAVQALEVLAPFEITLREAAEFYVRHARPPAGDRTVREVIEELLHFKENFQKARPRYLSDLRSRLGRFALTFGDRLIKEVHAEEIEKWIFEDENLGDLSRDNYRRALSVMFSFAQGRRQGRRLTKAGYRADNPMENVHAPRIEEEPPKILSVAQAESLLRAAAESDAKKGLLAFVTLGLFCGLRTTELLQLQWSHVRLDGSDSCVTVPAGIAKKRRLRIVELPENAREWLAIALRQASGAIAPPNAAKRLGAVGKLAGIKPWPNNAMRHSFGSYDFARHGNAPVTAAKLGHRNDQVLFDHYRALATRKEGERYFQVFPPKELGQVVPFEAAR